MKQERFDEIKENYGNLDFVQELLELCKEFKDTQTTQSVDCMKQIIEIDQLTKKNEIMLDLLNRFHKIHDGEECDLDHHGYCQAHFLEDTTEEGCTVKLLRKFIEGR